MNECDKSMGFTARVSSILVALWIVDDLQLY